jgi:hypothetical protein
MCRSSVSLDKVSRLVASQPLICLQRSWSISQSTAPPKRKRTSWELRLTVLFRLFLLMNLHDLKETHIWFKKTLIYYSIVSF